MGRAFGVKEQEMGALCGVMETSVCWEQCFVTVFLFLFLFTFVPKESF